MNDQNNENMENNSMEPSSVSFSIQAIDCINILMYKLMLKLEECAKKGVDGMPEAISEFEEGIAELEMGIDDEFKLVVLNPPQLALNQEQMKEIQEIQNESPLNPPSKKFIN